MPPDDPLGRHGPSLDNFLRKKPLPSEHRKQPCPYGETQLWLNSLSYPTFPLACPIPPRPAGGFLVGTTCSRPPKCQVCASSSLWPHLETLSVLAGKKCTYGIKCRFFHPERPSRPQRSVADELRANALLSPPRTPVKDKSSQRSSPAPQPSSVSLEAEPGSPDGKKLGARSSPGPHQEGSTQTCPPAGRSLPISGGSFGPTEWPPHTLDSLPYTSQECLDSGIGSLESQMSELWGLRGGSPGESGPSRGPYAGYHSYGSKLPAAPPFSPFPQAMGAGHFSVPTDYMPPPPTYPAREYWSEPYPLPPPTPVLQETQRPSPGARGGPWGRVSDLAKERAGVYTKLCGVFPPHLVEATMGRFPQILDPQQLAAEILSYNSHHLSE